MHLQLLPERLKALFLLQHIMRNWDITLFQTAQKAADDIIQRVVVWRAEGCHCILDKGIQARSSVDSYVTPVPLGDPGYDSGCALWLPEHSVQGSSIGLECRTWTELSRRMRGYIFQGGLYWPSCKLGILMSLEYLIRDEVVTLK